MIQVLRRTVLALAGVLLASAGLAAIPASAAPPAARPLTGACADDTGVTVVVDFGSLDGGVQIRCVHGPVESGFDALTKAGFTFAGTQRYPGLLCRIDGQPTAEEDPCVNAPPPKSYWGYWHASRGGAWAYQTSGAGTYQPPPGSVEGWAYGASRSPGMAPPAQTAPATTARPPTSTTPPLVDGPGTTVTSAPSVTPPGDATTTSTTSGGATTTTTETGLTDPTRRDPHDVTTREAESLAAGTAAAEADPGSPVGVLVGLGAVAAVGAGAFVRSRRRPEDPS